MSTFIPDNILISSCLIFSRNSASIVKDTLYEFHSLVIYNSLIFTSINIAFNVNVSIL